MISTIAKEQASIDAVKRAADVALAGSALAVTLPLWGLIAVAIRLDSPGPALFRQVRVGRGGRTFVLFKFRTMRLGTPELPTEEMMRQDRDPRTRIGKWLRRLSLDELPQLLNVVRGEMSLVGPRPALPSQTSLNARRRASGVETLLPGITGWAQVNGRDDLDEESKVACDQYYLERRSLALDLRILLRTVAPVLSGRGNR